MVIELTTPSIVYVTFRQRAVIILLLGLGLALTVAYCLLATPQYQSAASLVVTFSRQTTGTPGADQGSATAASTPVDHDEIINSYILFLQSNSLAAQVINEIGLERIYPRLVQETGFSQVMIGVTKFLGIYQTPMERAVYRFVNKDLTVEVEKDSNVMQISLLNADPDTGKRALALLIDHFLEQEARIGRDPQLAFVQGQVDVYKNKVADAQGAMEAFQLKNGISAMDEEISYLLKQRSDLEAQLAGNKVQIQEDQHKVDVLQAQLRMLSETVDLKQEDRDLALDAARTQLVQLQVRQQTLLSSFGADSPAVRALDTEVAKVQDFINSYPSRVPLRQMAPNPTYQVTQSALLQTEADLKAAIGAQPIIQQQMDGLSARLADRSREQATYQDLVREYQIDDENYRAYLQAVQQARIADDLNKQKITTIAIFDPAHAASALPAQPKKTLVIAGGLVLGLVLGFSFAFLRETWDERLNTPTQVNMVLGLPVLGSMARLDQRADSRGRQR